MKRLAKKLMTVALVGGIFLTTATLGACNKVPDAPKDDDKQHEYVDPNLKPDDGKEEQTPNTPVVDPDADKKALEEAAGKVLALIGEAQKFMNFHYVEGDVNMYAQNVSDGFKFKYSTEESDTYYVGTKNPPDAETYYNVYKIYQDENANWVGEITTDEGPNTENPFALLSATFSALDGEILVGNLGEKEVFASVNDDLTAVTWTIDGQNYAVDQICEINLTIPEFKDLTVQEEYIYETVNGQRQYNIPLLAKTLEETLKSDSSILTKANSGRLAELIKVTHVKRNEDKLLFGAYFYNDTARDLAYRFFSINEDLLQNKEMSSKAFSETIKNNKVLSYFGATTSCETSTLENDPEFDTMAQNVLLKLAQDGCQGGSINNKAESIAEFKDAKVLFGYKTKHDGVYAGGDLGDQTASKYMLLVDTGESVVQLDMLVSVAMYSNEPQHYLLNFNPNKVLIISLKQEEIDKENAKIYENNDNIKLNTRVTPYFEEKSH